MSLRDEILDSGDLEREPLDLDTSEPVYLRAMSGTDGDYMDSELILESDEDGNPTDVAENVRARMLVRCIVDEDGERVFSDDDAEEFGHAFSSGQIQGWFTRLLDISGAGEDFAGVEELAGNSATARSASSATVSP